MSNIRKITFKNIEFYFTNKSSIQCKKEDKEYIKPLYYTQERAKIDDITIRRSYTAQNGREYTQYGNVSYEQLNEIWTQNNGLFEVLKDQRKPYFDVEFPNNELYNHKIIYKTIIKAIKKVFQKININIEDNQIYSCYVEGKYSNGAYIGLNKHSYHIVINNNHKFQSLNDIIIFKTYLSNYCNDLLIMKQYDILFKSDNGCVIDFNVYGKNQCFKLPYQSKASNNYFQVPKQQSELKHFLISYGIENYDIINIDTLNKKNNNKILKIKDENKFYHIPKTSQNIVMIYDNCLKKLDENIYKSNDIIYDVSPETLIKHIYNGDTIDYNIFMAVGSALKRIYNKNPKNKGFELFDEWSKKSNKYDYNYTKEQFNGFSSQTCGYNTLFYLASMCNENIIKFKENPINFIMDDNIYKPYMNKEKMNIRYLPPINDYLNKYDNLFIKSPMGTGKSYGLHNIFNETQDGQIKYKRIIYLSSRQAFACAMASDFEQDGFINYLDKERFNGKNERVIISLESLNRIHYDDCDILVIDESESIFNIISSETLIKNKLEENLIKLYSLITLSKKVLIMDAFLSNRSIKVLTDIKEINKTNSYYIENEYQYEERYYELCEKGDKKIMINKIINLLQEKKRVVLCTGSKTVGDMLIQNIKKHNLNMVENVNYKFYNKLNQLPNNTNVNEEWKNIQLLIYSPTITCGISYDNKNYKFDNLFIYCVNRGSSHFRDMIQAHKRIREFTDKTINICINDNYKGFNPEQYPINYEIMKEYLTTHKNELIFDNITQNNIKSLKDNDLFKNWVFDIHIYNKIEMNINMIYLNQVVMKYFKIENIVKKGYTNVDYLDVDYLEIDNWEYDKIENINKKQYDEIIEKFKNHKYDKEDYKKIKKYNFVSKIKTKYDLYFNAWHTEENRKYINNIMNFNKMVSIGFENYEKFAKSSDNIEYYNKNLLSFYHIMNIFKRLNIIDENNNIHTMTQFKSTDFDEIVEEYKTLSPYAINQLFNNEYLKTKDKNGNKKKFTTRTAHSMLNKLLKDFFNYEIFTLKKEKIMVNKKQKKITKYMISPINTTFDLFNVLKKETQTNIDFIE